MKVPNTSRLRSSAHDGIDGGQPAHHWIGGAQGLHGGQRTAVGRAEPNHVCDARAGRIGCAVSERRAGQQAAHAVANQRQGSAAIGAQPRRQLRGQRAQVLAPVIVVQHHVETGRLQPQFQRQVAVDDAAEWLECGIGTPAKFAQAAAHDIARVEP